MALSHLQAKAILHDAWLTVFGRPPSASELAYTQAIAWLENQYGRAGQFAAMASAGQFNWGSLHAKGTPPDCPAGSAPGADQGSVCFLVFPNDDQAAQAFIRTLAKNRPTVLAAMSGTPENVAHAMKATGYYTAPEGTYANAIRSALAATSGIVPAGAAAGAGVGSLVLLGGAAYLAYSGGLLDRLKRMLG